MAMAMCRNWAASLESHSMPGLAQRKLRYSIGSACVMTCRQWNAPNATADTVGHRITIMCSEGAKASSSAGRTEPATKVVARSTLRTKQVQ
eukprot:scaffold286661_cov26-Tisochrysis_lutea.AAC.5